MTKTEIDKVLADHKKWLENAASGSCANLHKADLRNADLRNVDLRGADLSNAALRGADLRGANLHHADLRFTDLRYSDLTGADLCGADLDYSSWPLGCGSLDVKIDKRIAAQCCTTRYVR